MILELNFEGPIQRTRGERTKKHFFKEEIIYGRLRNSIQYNAFRELHLDQWHEGPRRRVPEIKSMWLIVRTEAAEVSRDRSEGVMFVVPERIQSRGC